MISKIKPQLNKFLENLIGPISKNWNPNVITISSVFISIIPMYLFSKGEFIWGALSMLLYVFDTLDGTVARAHGKVNKFGGYLDAVCDRFADGMVFLGFALSGVVRLDLCILALIGGFMVSYTKAKGEVVVGIDAPGANQLSIGFAERSERLIIIFIVSILLGITKKTYISLNILELGLVLLVILTLITTIMRVYKTNVLLKITQS